MKKDTLNRKAYPTDLTDEQWAVIAPLFSGMRQYKSVECSFVPCGRALPHEFPPYSTVHSFYRRARLSGFWDKILQHLVKVTRRSAGRNQNPTYSFIDSQSVDTAYASEQIGFDGGKKTKDINATS